MAGLLTGLLSAGLSQDPNTTFGERMQMAYTPHMYQQEQLRAQQAATEQALGPLGVPESMRHAMALDPNLLKQFGGAYGPGESEIMQIPTEGGGSITVQKRRLPGGQYEVKPINFGATPPPGTTTNPTQAVSPQPQGPAGPPPASAPNGGQPQGAGPTVPPPQAPMPPTQFPAGPTPDSLVLPQDASPGGGGPMRGEGTSQPMPAGAIPQPNQDPYAGYKTPAGVYPGTAGDTMDKIRWGQQHNASKEQLIQALPDVYQNEVRALLQGDQIVKDLATRGVGESDRSKLLRYGHMIDPHWDEVQTEALATWKKGYFNQGTQNATGYLRQAAGTTFQHIDTALDDALDLHSNDSDVVTGAHLANRARAVGGDQAQKIRKFKTDTGLLAPEVDKYVSGRAATDSGSNKQLEAWDPYATPREQAASARGYLDIIKGKMREMEIERDSNLKHDPASIANYPITQPEHLAMIAKIEAKIKMLERMGETAARTAPSGQITGQPSRDWQPPTGWTQK